MKKLLGIVVLGLLLHGCATLVDQDYSLERKNEYVAMTSMYPKSEWKGFFTFYTLGIYKPHLFDFYAYSNKSKEDAASKSEKKCTDFRKKKDWELKANCQLTYSRSTTNQTASYSSSSSSSSRSSSKPKPRLYYDSFTGGMRECSHDAPSGKCLSFKPYNASSYDKDTLFYNSSTDAMQPCFGIITVTGKCSAYGIFNHIEATADKGQLYYDSKNKKMTTCSFVTLSGKCTMYDLVPNKWSKSPGVFKEPGSDIIFKEPGSDIIFKEPGSDIF